MSYKDYIQESIQAINDELEMNYIISVVNEVNFNYMPKENEIHIVIKELSGSVTSNVRFMPIQFNVYTGANEVNDTKAIFNEFVNKYSNTSIILDNCFYKQDYQTPIDIQNFIRIGSDKRAMLLVTGTLMITTAVSDITELRINNELINYTSINFNYGTNVNTRKLTSEYLQKCLVANANLLITITAYCQTGIFDSLITLLRKDRKSPNDTYTISLKYTDGKEEEYRCIIQSSSSNYDISNPPTRTVVFSLC